MSIPLKRGFLYAWHRRMGKNLEPTSSGRILRFQKSRSRRPPQNSLRRRGGPKGKFRRQRVDQKGLGQSDRPLETIPSPCSSPCHRVLGNGDRLTGYSLGGAEFNETLLSGEREKTVPGQRGFRKDSHGGQDGDYWQRRSEIPFQRSESTVTA